MREEDEEQEPIRVNVGTKPPKTADRYRKRYKPNVLRWLGGEWSSS